MKDMNEIEALEFFKGVELKFSHYYKYSFHYVGKKDGIEINVTMGGNSSDIYRTEYCDMEIFEDLNYEEFNVYKSSDINMYPCYCFSEV